MAQIETARDDDRSHVAGTIMTSPVSDKLEYLDEELAEAFPPHFAL